MDLSSLPEAEQQQLQQLHQQFKEHQAAQQQQYQQQQQQQQQYQDYSYDPTQVQSYDQSTQAYHSYYQQQQQHYGYYQHHDYDYDYSAYQQPPHQQPESVVPVNPSGLSVSNGSAAQVAEAGGAGDSVQQNAYYPGQQVQGPMPPLGLNPAAAAAVVALSQLTQFAGTMDAAERAMAGLHPKVEGFGPMHYGPGPMRPPVGWSPYGGGGRRGGGRRNFGNRHPRSGSSGPPFGGKGCNRGRGRHRRFPPHGSSSTSSRPEPSTAEDAELTEGEAEPSVNLPEEADQSAVPPEASQSAPAMGKVAPNRRPPQRAWCELCRVDCTSLEILEQHKNGKRHKKNLQRIEESKIAVKPGTEIQNQQKPIAKSEPEGYQQAENAQEGEEKMLAETVSAEAVNDENKMDSEQENNTEEQPEVTAESSKMQAEAPRLDRFDNQRRGVKRKMRGGRGGKRMKTFDPLRRPNEPPKPKVVIPLICDLCSVKCDTQEVFDRHLSGKKHIAKLKRFEGHQAMYGPVGLQALYPPNPIAQTLFLPQSHQQQFYDPQGSHPPPGAYMPPQIHQAPAPAAGLDPQYQQNPNPQYFGDAQEVGSQNGVALAPEAQNQFTAIEPEIRQAVTVEANQPTNGFS